MLEWTYEGQILNWILSALSGMAAFLLSRYMTYHLPGQRIECLCAMIAIAVTLFVQWAILAVLGFGG